MSSYFYYDLSAYKVCALNVLPRFQNKSYKYLKQVYRKLEMGELT